VDQALAARNAANVKPDEPFSPFKPILSFANALGFTGPPDRYELAKKTVDEQKAGAAQAAAEQAQSGDVQIEALIEKSADGQTRESVALGSGTNASRQPTDKNGDTKRNGNKNDKKKTAKKPS
jgi:hypothetical protein